MKRIGVLAVFLLLAGILQAANVVMTNNDGFGTSSFNTGGTWSPAGTPVAGNTYTTAGFLLRTPSTAGNYTFAGDSLTVGGGAGGGAFVTDGSVNNNSFINKTPTGAIITVNNLILDGSYIRDGMGTTDVWTLAGNLLITTNNGGFAAQCTFNVNSTISGSGTLYIARNGSGEAGRTVYINSPLNTYTGNIRLLGDSSGANYCRLTFSDNSMMNFVIENNGVNNNISGIGTVIYNGDFSFDLTNASVNVGDSWTIAGATAQTFGDTFTVAGFTPEIDGMTWTQRIGSSSHIYEFSETTGILTVKVQPPHDPVPAHQAVNVPITTATLNWKGGQLLDGSVDPNIVKYYVYTNEDTLSETEPNLTLQGEVPLGVTADASYIIGVPLTTDLTFYWQIEQVMDTGSGTAGDPNNVMGPVWSFSTPISTPVIGTQPSDVRVFVTDPNAVFSVEFTSYNPVTPKWYKDDVELIAGGDILVTSTATSSKLQINTPSAADQGKYYCVLSVSPTVSVESASVLLVIKKLLAQYDFEGNLSDGSTNGAPAGIAKQVSLSDPNEILATSTTLAYVSGIDGTAVLLAGNQFVDFSVNGYPKAGSLNTTGDARGESFERTGFGDGMDQGSILCWIKPSTIGAVYTNANADADDTHFGLTTTTTNNARMIVRGENSDGSYQEIGTASGGLNKGAFSLQDGQWHMFAASWQDSTVRVYIDGEQAAATTTGLPEVYNPWERPNLVGVSRGPAATRHLLNNFLTGAIDSLRIYNYVKTADEIAIEYATKNELGYVPCANHTFEGSEYNFDNSGYSYCRIDLADFAAFARQWLTDGLY